MDEERDEPVGERFEPTRLPPPPEWNYERPAHTKKPDDSAGRTDAKGLGFGLAIVYSLVGCMAVGWGIGWLVDRQTGGEMGQPIGALVGSIIGMIASIMLVHRLGSRS